MSLEIDSGWRGWRCGVGNGSQRGEWDMSSLVACSEYLCFAACYVGGEEGIWHADEIIDTKERAKFKMKWYWLCPTHVDPNESTH